MSNSLLIEVRGVQLNTFGTYQLFEGGHKAWSPDCLTSYISQHKTQAYFSSSPLDTTHLANSIMRDKQVDVARTIPNELKMVAESGRIPRAKANFPLVFPAFIMSICARGRVHIPLGFHETLTGTTDGMQVARHCVPKKKKVSSGASSSGTMDFQNQDPRQKIICNYR